MRSLSLKMKKIMKAKTKRIMKAKTKRIMKVKLKKRKVLNQATELAILAILAMVAMVATVPIVPIVPMLPMLPISLTRECSVKALTMAINIGIGRTIVTAQIRARITKQLQKQEKAKILKLKELRLCLLRVPSQINR